MNFNKEKDNSLKKNKGLLFLKMAIIITVLVVIIGAFLSIKSKYIDFSEASLDVYLDEDVIDTLTVDELVKSYEEDKKLSDENYLNTDLRINGVIEKIDTSNNNTNVYIKTDSKYKVVFKFDEAEDVDIYSYTKGDCIHIYGYLIRKGNNLEFVDCYLDIDVFEVDNYVNDLILFANKNNKNFELEKENTMSFDSDILAYLYKYSDIVDNLSKISKEAVSLDVVKEKSVNDKVLVELNINSKSCKIELDNNKFDFDKRLISEINKQLELENSTQFFYYSCTDYSEDFDIITIIYATENEKNILNELINSSKNATNELNYLNVEIFQK